MSQANVLTINIDGAARGNPGPAAIAFVIVQSGQLLLEGAECLGSTTNNVAEYTALVRALEKARELGGQRLLIRSDSELVVKQMNGLYRVKNNQLSVLHEQAKELEAQFASVSIVHVRRGQNSRADHLCNEVLDGARRGARSPASAEHAPDSEDASTAMLVREEALLCLRSAARAWAEGNPAARSPEEVWEALWGILLKNGIVRASPQSWRRRVSTQKERCEEVPEQQNRQE